MPIAFAVLLVALCDDPPVDQALIDHLRTAYRANRAAFVSGDYRFEMTRGAAQSDEDARLGRLREGSTARGRYAFTADLALYENLFDEKEMNGDLKSDAGRKATTTLRSYRILRDSTVALIDNVFPDLNGGKPKHSIKISPIGTPDYEVRFPLEIGEAEHKKFSLSNDLDAANDGKVKVVSVDPKCLFRGRDVVRLELRSAAGTRTYWIDLERGAVPLSIRDVVDGGATNQVDLDDVRPVDGGGWLPFAMTQSIQNGSAVFRLVVLKADVTPPPRSAFQLEFDEPRTLVDAPRQLHYTKGRKVWRLDDLPAKGADEARPLRSSFTPEPPAMAGESTRRWSTWWLVVAGLTTLGLIAWAVYALKGSRSSR
jgi:hypothetical protein